MRNARTVWLAAIYFLALGAGLSAMAKEPKAAPVVVTYYYLPG